MPNTKTRSRTVVVPRPPTFEEFCQDHGGRPILVPSIIRNSGGYWSRGHSKVYLLPDGAWAARSESEYSADKYRMSDPPTDRDAALHFQKVYWWDRMKMIEADFKAYKKVLFGPPRNPFGEINSWTWNQLSYGPVPEDFHTPPRGKYGLLALRALHEECKDKLAEIVSEIDSRRKANEPEPEELAEDPDATEVAAITLNTTIEEITERKE